MKALPVLPYPSPRPPWCRCRRRTAEQHQLVTLAVTLESRTQDAGIAVALSLMPPADTDRGAVQRGAVPRGVR
jgi:hypothetical protein